MVHTSKIARLALLRRRSGLALWASSIALGLLAAGPGPSFTAPQTVFPNSLWIGTDNTSSRNVLNMDRAGVILGSVGPVECTAFAIDPNLNIIYFGTGNGGITA